MILKFPDLETLRLALLSGIVPGSVSATAARAGWDEQAALWVETTAALTRSTQLDLKKLGVQTPRASAAALRTEVSCWPELLPLQPETGPLDRPEQTPILFLLPSGAELARFVSEMLRLGNDRQTYRWLEDGAGSARVLLRVVGPPYYTLLRALTPADETTAPRAFLERAPRVWVELGWTHPLVEHLKPAEGKLLLLQPPACWTQFDEAPFHDIYEVLEFPLPNAPSRYREGLLSAPIQVTPSLKASGSQDAAELWVLHEAALDELNDFVQHANDHLLQRLAFAVGEQDDQRIVVLRVRPSKLPPPVLTLNAVAYRPWQRLPNLFLPVGKRLHPPLRRDLVRQLLASDPAQVTWLAPDGASAFTPTSLPEDSFRPLSDWVDYVLERDRVALQAWVQAAQFDFEPFLCDEDQQARPKKPASDKKRSSKKDQEIESEATGGAKRFDSLDKTRSLDEKPPELDAFSALPQATPSELEQQRRTLEERFLALEGGLDAPARQQLWPELAQVNTALDNAEDAASCWLHALWYQTSGPLGWKEHWFQVEAKRVPLRKEAGLPRGRSWVSSTGEVSGPDLDRVLRLPDPAEADVRALAAYVVWAGSTQPSPVLQARLQPVQHFLEQHERLLPVRAAWLAWSQLVQLSGGDVLALARTRDRLLERLFYDGLRPEKDLPVFLRSAGRPANLQSRNARQRLLHLCELARQWSSHPDNKPLAEGAQNRAYIDLFFAYGLARLGELDASHDLVQRAKEAFGDNPADPHGFLLQAFNFRIQQARDGRAAQGALPPEQMEYLETQIEKLERYAVDRLRQFSRILEPDTKLDPYRHWGSRRDDFEKALSELADVFDRLEVAERVARLLKGLPKSATGLENRAKILSKALEIAPRVTEEFACSLLDQVAAAFDALPEPRDVMAFLDRAELLEKALFVAAHFDRLEHIQPLVTRFQTMLTSKQSDYALQAMDKLAGRCLRGLRKLGMQDEIEHLLKVMSASILDGADLRTLMAQPAALSPALLRALLHVAGGWYYFNRDAQAEPILQAARAELLRPQLEAKEKAPLAVVYAATLAQAPSDVAEKRLEELFTKMHGFRDGFTTATYYARYQLEVVEAVVLAVVSDDFTLGTQARRWLDEDEFLVRRRIHRDMKALLARN